MKDVYDVVTDGSGRVPMAVAFNAGIGRAGRFVDGDVEADLDIVDLNVRSTVHLAKLSCATWIGRGVAARCSRRRSWR